VAALTAALAATVRQKGGSARRSRMTTSARRRAALVPRPYGAHRPSGCGGRSMAARVKRSRREAAARAVAARNVGKALVNSNESGVDAIAIGAGVAGNHTSSA